MKVSQISPTFLNHYIFSNTKLSFFLKKKKKKKTIIMMCWCRENKYLFGGLCQRVNNPFLFSKDIILDFSLGKNPLNGFIFDNSDLQYNCKDSLEFPYIFYLAFPEINILHNNGRFIKTKMSTLLQNH